MISWRASARKRVFSVSLRFAPFVLPVFMSWGKRQISLISPLLASVILQNFEFPHPFPSNSKQCREFSPAQGQRSQFIPLYSPTYSPGWPGVLYQALSELQKHFFRLFSFSIRHLFVFSIRLGRMNLIKTLFPYVLCSITLNAIETMSSAK